ncbi:MAG: NrdH-redoxin [Actinomyces sp.]|nr:NrdH-redoxin [Actinomyces sp.]
MTSSPTQFEVFTQPACMPCKLTKKYLTKHDLAFEEYPAQDHLEALKAQGISSAPGVFAYRDGAFIGAWAGYRPDLIKQAADGEAKAAS